MYVCVFVLVVVSRGMTSVCDSSLLKRVICTCAHAGKTHILQLINGLASQTRAADGLQMKMVILISGLSLPVLLQVPYAVFPVLLIGSQTRL